MIAFIEGTIIDHSEDTIILENQGIGFNIVVSKSTLFSAPSPGSRLRLYTHMNVREGAKELFGYVTREELDLFRLLISVSGIGPKVAMGVLGNSSPSDLRFAILSEDISLISKAPGVGKKTAQRLIIELKDKISEVSVGGTNGLVAANPISHLKQEALDALTALGYSATAALKALDEMQLAEDDRPEAVIKQALIKLSMQ